MRIRGLIAGAVFGAIVASGMAVQADVQRGVANYRAVISGAKQLKDLSPQEIQEVLVVYRALRPQPPAGSSQECRTAWDDAISKADELQDQAKKLATCAGNRDFSDDCDMEARHARDAQDDYENATSHVHSECQ